MAGEHTAAGGFGFDDLIYMFEERAVAATHVTNANGLLIERAIKELDDDSVGFPEVVVVSSAAAPNVHATIDKELTTGLVDSWNAGVAKQECGQDIEHRQIGDGDSVGGCDPGGVSTGSSQSDKVLMATGPSEKLEQVKNARHAARIAGQAVGINASGRVFKEPKDTFACERYHCRSSKHTVQIGDNLPVDFCSGGIAFGVDTPALASAADKILEMGDDSFVRFAEQEVIEKKRLRDEGDDLTIKRRKPHCNITFCSKSVPCVAR